jgi:hypothetical protein
MPKQYPTVLHEWFEEVWNQKNASAIDRLLAADAIFDFLTMHTQLGTLDMLNRPQSG